MKVSNSNVAAPSHADVKDGPNAERASCGRAEGSPLAASAGAFSHPFWMICRELPKAYWNYEDFEIEFNNDLEAYDAHQKIGQGKYSEVFRGWNRTTGRPCVLKILKPVRYRKIQREISILQNLCGGPNVVRLLDVLQDARTNTIVLVTEYVENPVTLRWLMNKSLLENFDLRYYMYEILRTLDFAHRRGIFHRDIKPHNIMIDHKHRILRVIDWGLAEYYLHNEALNCGVATRHYKGPELLLGYRHYDFSLDIWCLGCVFAGIIFHADPFFDGYSNEDQLLRIVAVFGTDAVRRYVAKYNAQIPRAVVSNLEGMAPGHCGWKRFVKSSGSKHCDDLALNLLDKMLQFDHQDRIMAHDAMTHPYFEPVRRALESNPNQRYPFVPV
ncbi:unnamed protein product [Phytomonas sp. EM1]|nr:unnamed protein product [Phytomonas sp. EM1]|eukprot:CCW62883.1 unnamed protein product [Phytomonas sp. isolate EM1]